MSSQPEDDMYVKISDESAARAVQMAAEYMSAPPSPQRHHGHAAPPSVQVAQKPTTPPDVERMLVEMNARKAWERQQRINSMIISDPIIR